MPIHPHGPEPKGFTATPLTTKLDVVKAQLDAGARMALLDARAPSDYIGEHIPDAVSVPFYDPDSYLAQLPRDAWLVCYCSCPHAESGQLAQKLVQHGFTKVTVLDEGLRTWKAKGYATHSGFDPEATARPAMRRGAYATTERACPYLLIPRSTRSASTPARSRTPSPAR